MKYKILDSSGLAFGRNSTGQELEYIRDFEDYGVLLLQPPFDVNGVPCIGTVVMDKKSVELVEEEKMKFKVIAVYDYWVKFVIVNGPAKELKLPKKCFSHTPEVGDLVEITTQAL